jgi:H+/Cl- antiporter ClcA
MASEPQTPAGQAPSPAPADPAALLRSRQYLVLVVFAALIGAPVAAAVYFFLKLISLANGWLFTDIPKALGFHGAPVWWPVLPLAVGGVFAALAIQYLPGRGGHSPADGFQPHGAPGPRQLPGIFLAAFATLAFGAVLGPEAPSIALGGGLAALAIRLVRRGAPPRAIAVIGAAGSFAGVSTLLGSPLVGAVLLIEAAMLGGGAFSGGALGLIVVPGLLASGIGALIFTGLGTWTGFGTFSLAIPELPHFARPDVAEFGWALVIGVAAAIVAASIRWLGLYLRPYVERRLLLAVPLAGLAVAGLAIAYAEGAGRNASEVLFSGQTAIGPLVDHAASYTVGALALLLVCKGLAYGISLSAFRGGPTFPALLIGAAGGILLSHLPGLALVPGVAMGIGAMSTAMLRLPVTSVLLASLLLFSDGVAVVPVVIVAVVVAHLVTAHLVPEQPPPPKGGVPEPGSGDRVVEPTGSGHA